ncbi:MAG: hypothetical protein II839_05520 [Kiritimatiellae bacterium]|nr:hypothetical protein [Kiritimatiellia bacterium]
MDDPVFSPAFFWMWNAPLDADALCAQLEDMRAHGLRNVCIHPFPKGFRPKSCPSGMEPDYLAPAFLDVFAAVVRRAGELGMHAWLYDEGGWPSGGACGLVAASDPEGRFASREVVDGDAAPRARPHGPGAPYPSLLEPGATQRFLDLTHEAYAARLGGALGTTVRIAFTDEPDMPGDTPGHSLAWTSDFDAEFRRRKGYDVAPFVPALLGDPDGTDPTLCRVRIDVQDVKSDLFVERYLAPLRDWCRAHDLLSGGHLNHEDTPETARGSILRGLRAMDVPGVDAIWRQLFPGKDVNPFPRYAASAMHQNGGRFALSESFAIYGDSLSPVERKWIVDAQLVRGINLFVFAYFAQSNARHWMTLFEPHAGPADPTWDFQPHFFRYVERTARFLSRGRPGAETAVLLNVRAFWAGKPDREAAAAAHYAAAKALDEANVDYDFVEDRDLAAAEILPDGRLRVGAMDYRAVVLPGEAWMLPEAKEALARFEAAGGIVARGAAQLDRVPRTLRIAGDGARAIRVLSRVDGARRIWFLMNEDLAGRPVEIAFPGGGPVVRYDPDADAFESVPVDPDGILRRVFAPGETALYVSDPDFKPRSGDLQARSADLQPRSGDLTWSLRPLVSHVAGSQDFEIRTCESPARPVALGDWRGELGETFSGKALCRAEFDAPEDADAVLDLGDVKWCAAVRLNGADLGARFFGPFRWRVRVAKGRNVLEVTVANLLANQVGDDAIRDRILRDWQPNGSYDARQRLFDRDNHASGLFGPVTLRRTKP